MNTIPIPADPESRNGQRAEAALITLKHFAQAYGELDELAGIGSLARQNVVDLLTNLAHMCDRLNISFLNCIESAHNHYTEETAGKGEQFDELRIHETT